MLILLNGRTEVVAMITETIYAGLVILERVQNIFSLISPVGLRMGLKLEVLNENQRANNQFYFVVSDRNYSDICRLVAYFLEIIIK